MSKTYRISHHHYGIWATGVPENRLMVELRAAQIVTGAAYNAWDETDPTRAWIADTSGWCRVTEYGAFAEEEACYDHMISEAARRSEPLVQRLRQGFLLDYAEAEGIDDVTWASLVTLPNFVEVEGEGYRLEAV